MQGDKIVIPPEAVLQWLFHEMKFKPLKDSGWKDQPSPTLSTIRLLLRGNLVPFWHFLLTHVRHTATVRSARQNLILHSAEGVHVTRPQRDESISSKPVDTKSLHGKSVLRRGGKSKWTGRPRAMSLGDKRKGFPIPAGGKSRGIRDEGNVGKLPCRHPGSPGYTDNSNLLKIIRLPEEKENLIGDIESLQIEVLKVERAVAMRINVVSNQPERHASSEAALAQSKSLLLLEAYRKRNLRLNLVLEEVASRLSAHAQRDGLVHQERNPEQCMVAGIFGPSFAKQMAGTSSRFQSHVTATTSPPSARKQELKGVCFAVAEAVIAKIQRSTMDGAREDSLSLPMQTNQKATISEPCMSEHSAHLQGTNKLNLEAVPFLPGPASRLSSLSNQAHERISCSPQTIAKHPSLGSIVGKESQQCGLSYFLEPTDVAALAGVSSGILAQPTDFIRGLADHCWELAIRIHKEKEPDAKYSRSAITAGTRAQADAGRSSGVGVLSASSVRRSPWKAKGSAVDKLLRERQRAHVERVQAVEMALTAAARACGDCLELTQHLDNSVAPGSSSSTSLDSAARVEVELLAVQRQVAGLRGWKAATIAEADRLLKQCSHRRSVQNELAKVWATLQQFDAERGRLMELSAYLRAVNKAASAAWEVNASSLQDESVAAIHEAVLALQPELSRGRNMSSTEMTMLGSVDSCISSSTCAQRQAAGGQGGPSPGSAMLRPMHVCGSDTAGSLLDLANAHWWSEEKEDEAMLHHNAMFGWKDTSAEHARKLGALAARHCEMDASLESAWRLPLSATVAQVDAALMEAEHVEQQLTSYWEQPGGFAVNQVSVEDDHLVQKTAAEWRATIQRLSTRGCQDAERPAASGSIQSISAS